MINPLTDLEVAQRRFRWRPLLFGAVGTTVATNSLILAVNLGSGIVLARSLGPSDRGILAAAILWPAILASTGSVGVAEGVTYLSGKAGGDASPILSSALAFGIVQSVVLILLGTLLLPLLLAGNAAMALGAALYYLWLIPLNLLTQYGIGLLQGRMSLSAFNFARLSVHVVYTALIIALWTQKAVTVRSAVTASLAAWAAAAVLTLWLIRRRGYWVWGLDLADLRALISFGVKLQLGNVATILASKLDIVVLTFLASAGSLGVYVVAGTVGPIVGLVPGALALVLYPRSVRSSTADWRVTLARLLLIGLTVTVLAGPVMIVALPRLIPIVFGEAFASAVPVAELLVLGYLFRGYAGMFVAMLRGAGRPLRASTGEIVGLMLFAFCLLILTRHYGVVGTATALTLSAAATLIWMVIQSCVMSETSPGQLWSLWKADLHLVAMWTRSIRLGTKTR
jgi:O-antigen/teichoic acid export membrane protein